MKIRYIYFVILVFSMFSCSDYLEKYPLDKPSSGNFPASESELEAAVNASYRNLWWDSGMPYVYWLDDATDIGWARAGWTGGGVYDIAQGQHSPRTSIVNSAWNNCYQGIAKCNFVLSNVEGSSLSSDYVAQAEAEVKVLRAYYYSILVTFFGDVPWVEGTISPEESYLPRKDKELILDNIFTDLDDAIAILPEEWGGKDEGRLTKGAALAIKARTALYHERYEIAAAAAKKVIDLGIYELYSNYHDLFQHAGVSNNEKILQVSYNLDLKYHSTPVYVGTRNTGGWATSGASVYLVNSYECTDGLPIDESPLFDPANPFENRDPRLKQTVMVPGTWFGGYLYETHPDSVTTLKDVGGSYSEVPNPEATNPYAAFTGYAWRKYLAAEDMADQKSTIPTMLIRYAEVLLIYAEAKIELNQLDQSVYDAINEVRGRESVNMPSIPEGQSQALLRRRVRNERKVELAMEGFRWIDIVRWGIADQVLSGDFPGKRHKDKWYDPVVPEITEEGHSVYPGGISNYFKVVQVHKFNPERDNLWPIPQSELDVNENLVQNPGY